MKIEITTHELTQLIADHAGLVSRVEVAESQLRGVQAELLETQKKVPSGAFPVEDTLAFLSKVFEALNSKNKIQAIKVLRETIKCGLKEAKDTIESGMDFCPHCASNGKVPINHACSNANPAISLPGSDDSPGFESVVRNAAR